MKKKPTEPTDRKTRAQRAKLTSEGVPPSPPPTLPAKKRAPRQPKPTPPTDTQPDDDVVQDTAAPITTPAEEQEAPAAPIITVKKPKTVRSKGKKPISYADASSQTPIPAPQGAPKPYNIPVDSSISHSSITITADDYPAYGSAIGHDALSFAVPTAFVPSIMRYITSHPSFKGTDLGYLTQNHPVAKRFSTVKKTMTVTKRVADPYVNGKLFLGNTKAVTFEVENPYADDEIPEPSSQPLHGLSSDPPTQVQQEQVLQPATQSQNLQQQIPETPRSRWHFTGLLPTAQSVAKFIPIPFSSRLTTSTTHAAMPAVNPGREELDFTRPTPHPISFAPRSHLQANNSNEAQTEPQVSNFEVAMNIDADLHTGLEANNEIGSQNDAEMHGGTETRGATGTHEDGDTPSSMVMHDAPSMATAATGPWKRKTLTKGQAEAKQHSEGRKKGLKAQTEDLMKERARLREEKEAFEKEKADFEAAQVTGEKRKRLPSQEPPKRGFHLTYDYSSSDSDEDDDYGQRAVDAQGIPVKSPNPAKRARVEGPDVGAVIGDLNSAQPYRGHMFSLPEPTIQDALDHFFPKGSSTPYYDAQAGPRNEKSRWLDNFFSTGSSNGDNDVQAEHQGESSRFNTTKRQPNTFKVPSPSDSDWEDTVLFDDNETIPNAQSPSASSSQSTFQTSPLASKQPKPGPAAGPSAEASKSLVPPPRPNPSHASLPPTLPTSGRPTFVVDPVEKARQKALKHQPVTGSRLRESSRLSTSTVGSEAEDEQSATIDNDEYDPKHPAILPSALPSTSPNTLPWPGYVNSYDEWKKSVSSRVGGFVDQTWNNVEDDEVAQAQFDQDMADFDAIDDRHGSRSESVGAVDVEEFRIDTEDDGLGINSRVQEMINASWRPEDGQAAEDQFDTGMASYYEAGLGLVA